MRKSVARVVVWGAAASLASSCVIPLSPEFEGEENLSPYFVSADPPIGSIIRRTSSDPELTFTVRVADPNLSDTLWYRFIWDYPAFTSNTRGERPTRLPASPNETPEREPITFPVNCVSNPADLAGQPHRLMLAVSDRGFTDDTLSDLRYTTVPEGAHQILATWSVYIDCLGQSGGR